MKPTVRRHWNGWRWMWRVSWGAGPTIADFRLWRSAINCAHFIGGQK
jgi:hypothetical protein